jgi:hypothetical protein
MRFAYDCALAFGRAEETFQLFPASELAGYCQPSPAGIGGSDAQASARCFSGSLGLIVQWLLFDGPLFASGLPWEFTLHVRIETLQHREALWIIVIKPAGTVEPIPIVAGMHGPELHVKVTDDVRVSFAGFEFFPGFDAIADGIDHAVAKIGGLVENDDFGMFVMVEKSRGIGPRMA